MSIFVAFNGYGDLVASADSYGELLDAIDCVGYFPDELVIGRWTP